MVAEIEQRVIEISSLMAGNKPTNLTISIKIPDNLGILENPKDNAPEHHGIFRVMTPKDGDKRIVWDSRDFSQIIDAKNMFNDLISKGFVPYKVGLNGGPSSEIMTEFCVNSEEVIFLPIGFVTGG